MTRPLPASLQDELAYADRSASGDPSSDEFASSPNVRSRHRWLYGLVTGRVGGDVCKWCVGRCEPYRKAATATGVIERLTNSRFREQHSIGRVMGAPYCLHR